MEHTHTDQPSALLSIGEAANRLGVSVDTVRRWEKKNKITSERTLGGQRRFSLEEIQRVKAGAK